MNSSVLITVIAEEMKGAEVWVIMCVAKGGEGEREKTVGRRGTAKSNKRCQLSAHDPAQQSFQRLV